MNTPIEDWNENPEDQKQAEGFFSSPAGLRLLRTLEFLGRPKAQIVPAGQDGINSSALIYQQSAGHFGCLDMIPKLFFSSIAAEKDQQIAADRINPSKAYTRRD